MNDQGKRTQILNKARKKYILGGTTKNITEALRLYLKNDAGPDEQIPLFTSTLETHQLRTILKKVRPRCDECDAELQLQTNARDPAGKEYPTAWICKNCGVVYYSDKSPEDWLKELQHENWKQNLQKSDELIRAEMPIVRQKPTV